MAFKMNKSAFNFGQGTGSALTKSPLTKSPPMGSEADQRREAKLMEEGPAVSGEMDAVVVTPKMEKKREKKKEKEANKKAREDKRKNKQLARLKKKEMKIVHGGKDSAEYKEASEALEALKTGKQKVKAKVEETKGKVKAKVEDIKTNVKDAVGKVKDKAKDLKSRITKSDEEKALKEQYKKDKKKAETKRKNPDVTFHDAVKIDLETGDAK